MRHFLANPTIHLEPVEGGREERLLSKAFTKAGGVAGVGGR